MSSFLINTLLRAPFLFVFLVAAAVSSPHFGQTGRARVLWRGFARLWRGWPTAHPDEAAGEPAQDASCEILPCRRGRAGRGKCSRPIVNGPGLITFVKDKLSVTRSLFIWQEHFLDLTLNQKAGVHSLVKDLWEAKWWKGETTGVQDPPIHHIQVYNLEKNFHIQVGKLDFAIPFLLCQKATSKMLYCSIQPKNNFLTKRKLRRPKNNNGIKVIQTWKWQMCKIFLDSGKIVKKKHAKLPYLWNLLNSFHKRTGVRLYLSGWLHKN